MTYDRRSSYHEAGHAVMAMLLGVEVVEVSISRRSGGVTRFTGPIADPCVHLPILLAGRVAEFYGCGDVDHDGWQEDRVFSEQAAYEIAEGDLAVADRIRAATLEHVRDVLATHWATVEALADQLLASPHGAILGADLNPTREVLAQ